MATLKTTLKNIIPSPLWQAASEGRYAFNRAAQWPAAAFHPLRRQSIAQLAQLKDVHHGKRCFIIGNGPSLKQTDLARLKGEFTFGMNRFYLAYPELGFTSTYYLSVNSLVIEQCAADILSLPIPKFVSWRSHSYFGPSELAGVPTAAPLMFLHTTYTGPKFARDARGRLWEGATVTYVAMQLAFHMGFRQVILIGVDHSFNTQGKPNTTVVSQGEDKDHFHAGYFGKGFRWQLPDLDTSERSYTLARETNRQAGREILDATVGGKLTVFPKVDYETLF